MNDCIDFSSDDNVNLEYTYNIGVSHAKRGNLRDAIFYFDKFLDVEPSQINALISKDNTLGKLGKHDQAISYNEFVLRVNPIHIICLLNKGLAFHHLGRYDHALFCYDKILEQNPDNARTLYNKALTKALQNYKDQVISFLERAIILDPEYVVKASQNKDFETLNNDSRFRALITRISQ